jgi:pyruvate,water dikinase
VDAALVNLFGASEATNTDKVLHGLSVNAGTYEGTARVVDSSADFGRIRQGDVLVARNTSPYFNVVLPLLGAIVTDRGGQLSHAAIVAREYGIPGVVGTREATSMIADGARVRVDGTTGEVHLLSAPTS